MTSNRTALTDGSNRWFNEKSAIVFQEDKWFNGRNMISKATGDQWEHEQLYYTKGGSWVLNHWSQWQGSEESYTAIDESEAIHWLIAQSCMGSDEIDDLPKSVQEDLESSIEAAEL